MFLLKAFLICLFNKYRKMPPIAIPQLSYGNIDQKEFEVEMSFINIAVTANIKSYISIYKRLLFENLN